MPKLNVISSDSHVVEPPDLWTRLIDPRFRDRAPRLVRGKDCDVYWCDGATLVEVAMMSSGGKTAEQVDVDRARWDEEVRPGGYDPKARLADMALDGLDAEVLYPTVALRMWSVPDLAYRKACFEAYNRWMAEEYVAPYRDILKGIALITVDDVAWSVRELHRAKDRGLSGACIDIAPKDRRFQTQELDPVWAAAEEMDLPITLHLATMKDPMVLQTPPDTIDMSMAVIWNIGTLIYSGVFMRFPKLKVISAENDGGWAVYYLPRMDMNVGDLQRVTKNLGGIDYQLRHGSMKPSEYFRRNVFLSFQRDRTAVVHRHEIGVENIMWGADYPHMEGTWPNSRKTFEWLFAGVPESDRRKIIRDNVARLYHFEGE